MNAVEELIPLYLTTFVVRIPNKLLKNFSEDNKELLFICSCRMS